MQAPQKVANFRNFIFGVEDSLVSTVGLLSGIAIASVPKETILLTGVVLIFVEAFSMSAGSYLSEASAEEYERGANDPKKSSLTSAIIMFVSYFIAGFVPVFPYLIWPAESALPLSIIFSVVALFILGMVSATISRAGMWRSAFRMALIGGIAIAVGASAGILLS